MNKYERRALTETRSETNMISMENLIQRATYSIYSSYTLY